MLAGVWFPNPSSVWRSYRCLLLCGCISANGPCDLGKLNGIMKKILRFWTNCRSSKKIMIQNTEHKWTRNGWQRTISMFWVTKPESRPESKWEYVERTEDKSYCKEAFQTQEPGDLCIRVVMVQNPTENVQTTYKIHLTTLKNKGCAINHWEIVWIIVENCGHAMFCQNGFKKKRISRISPNNVFHWFVTFLHHFQPEDAYSSNKNYLSWVWRILWSMYNFLHCDMCKCSWRILALLFSVSLNLST